jgi:hypothetical protein
MRSNTNILGLILVSLAYTGSAMAATSNGQLTVTGTLVSSLKLTVESAGGTTGGLGTDSATSALGTISKYGVAPTNFTLAQGVSDWTLSSNIGVKVVKGNVTSSDFTLTAALQSAPPSGLTWKVNGSTITNGSAATITSSAAYGSTASYSWNLVASDTAATGAINNAIIFTATSN